MPRPILDESRIHPAVRERVAQHFQGTLIEVQAAVAAHPVVVDSATSLCTPKTAI